MRQEQIVKVKHSHVELSPCCCWSLWVRPDTGTNVSGCGCSGCRSGRLRASTQLVLQPGDTHVAYTPGPATRRIGPTQDTQVCR